MKLAEAWLLCLYNGDYQCCLMVRDLGLGSHPDSATYPLSSFCYLTSFCLSCPILKMGIIISLSHNAVVKTQRVNGRKPLSTEAGASQVLKQLLATSQRNDPLAVKYQTLLPGGWNASSGRSVSMRPSCGTASHDYPWEFHFGTHFSTSSVWHVLVIICS